jgi:hypothetical protein
VNLFFTFFSPVLYLDIQILATIDHVFSFFSLNLMGPKTRKFYIFNSVDS